MADSESPVADATLAVRAANDARKVVDIPVYVGSVVAVAERPNIALGIAIALVVLILVLWFYLARDREGFIGADDKWALAELDFMQRHGMVQTNVANIAGDPHDPDSPLGTELYY